MISFSVTEKTISVRLTVETDREKRLDWKTRITEPKMMTAKLLTELMAREEHEHVDFDGDRLVRKPAIILDEPVRTKLAVLDFFRTVHSKLKQLQNSDSGEGYLAKVAALRRSEMRT